MADKWMDQRGRDWPSREGRRWEGRGGEDRLRADDDRRGEERSWYDDPYRASRRGFDDEDYGPRSGVTAGGAMGQAGRASGEGARAGGLRFSSQDYTESERDQRDRSGGERPGSPYGGPYGAKGYRGEAGGAGRPRAYRPDRLRWDDEGPSFGYRAERSETRGWDLEDERGYGRDEERRFYGNRDQHERDQYARDEGPGDFLHRAGERISSWFRGDNLMRGSREESQHYRSDDGREVRPLHRGSGPKGYQRSDERISDEVHERLTDDPWVDASEIQVEVKNGEVTLSGHVDNREAKHRAERLIEDLSGVRHVQNNLRVAAGPSLTSAGHGYGSSALEAEIRRRDREQDPGNNGVSGLSGRTSTGAAAEPSTDASTKRT
jgi:osmotically-inducible protein OsmY